MNVNNGDTMKRSKILMILAVVILVTGCGEKKLVCSRSKNDSYYGYNSITYKLDFNKKGNVKKFSINSVSDYYDNYINNENINMNDELTEAKKICDTYKDSKYASCNVELYSNKKIVVDLKFDLDKLTDDEITNFELTEFKTTTYDAAKEKYVKNGFTCK